MAREPEEQSQPGFFTDNMYGLSPVILDSANADTLAFADRFRARFGHDPTWETVAGYDAANLAVVALQAVTANGGANLEVQALRTALVNYLISLKSPAQAKPGLLGPFWFDEGRARQQAIRVGRFRGGCIESAPLQIVLVTTPTRPSSNLERFLAWDPTATPACSGWSIPASSSTKFLMLT